MIGYIVRVSRLVWGAPCPELVGEVDMEDLIVLLRQDATARRLEDDRLRIYVLEVLDCEDDLECVERRIVYGGYHRVEEYARNLAGDYAVPAGGSGETKCSTISTV